MTDEGFWMAFYGACRIKALSLARHRGFTREESEEIYHESLLRLYVHFDELKHPSVARTYLFKIQENLMVDLIRRAQVARCCVPSYDPPWQEENRGALAGEIPSDRPTPDTILEDAEGILELRAAMSRLPSEERALIVEHVFEGVSYPEMARRRGMKPGTLAVRAFRSMSRLRRAMAGRV